MKHVQLAARLAFLVVVLGLFFLSIEMMGSTFKLFGKDTARQILATTANPLVGLFAGILATTLVQSSSTVTSIVVGMVGSGMLPVAVAYPVVMGANIGTTVTNTVVSLGHITRQEEFRRAISGATVHDFFNFIAVLVLLPLHLATNFLHHISDFAANALSGVGGLHFASPLKLVTKPLGEAILSLLGHNPVLGLIVALLMLFLALRFLVSLLKVLVLERAERIIHEYVFKAGLTSMLFGILVTVFVQSSSVTTSVAVPFVGAGILTLRQLLPYVCGANIGTTITSVLAALVLQDVNALVIAFGHVFFNVAGVVLIYPIKQIRAIPLWLADRFGRLASTHRVYALVYIAVVFYVVPVLVIVLSRVV